MHCERAPNQGSKGARMAELAKKQQLQDLEASDWPMVNHDDRVQGCAQERRLN